MNIYYGLEDIYINITYLARKNFLKDGLIRIPKGDVERAKIFGDPKYGVVKHIKVGNKIYTANEEVLLNIEDISEQINDRKEWWEKIGKHISDPVKRLIELQNRIFLNYGSIKDEYPEQLMSIKYLKETDTVLEIGGNIGRNSCIIASILNDDQRLLTLESFPKYAKQLEENRNKNGFSFNIETSALSKVELIQKEWNTYVNDKKEIPAGYTKVNTICFEELKKKYKLDFNVLVVDCEGALYQILKDEPELLKNIERVIIENDFFEIEKKNFVDEMFSKNGLKCIYSQSGGWGPCQKNFYQVFSKN